MNDPDDLDALVTELNAGVPRAGTDGYSARLRGWLEQVVARSASDLLLVAGAPPDAPDRGGGRFDRRRPARR